MTPSQVSLLKRAIIAYQSASHPDEQLVEVSRSMTAVDPRTAESLVKVGLLEWGMPTWANEGTRNMYVRLPALSESEEDT